MIEKQDEFNGLIKAIFRGGKINPIQWGGDSETEGWNVWSIEEKLEFAMELASAMNQAADIMQKERNDMIGQVKLAEQKVESAQQQVDIQKQIVMTNLTESNERNQEYINQIQTLQTRVKTLEDVNGQLNEKIRILNGDNS